MTTERMLELSILFHTRNITEMGDKPINRSKIYSRYFELLEEFLNPYVIDNAEKSE